MSVLAINPYPHDHTAAFSSDGDDYFKATIRTGEPALRQHDDIVTIDNARVVSGGSFAGTHAAVFLLVVELLLCHLQHAAPSRSIRFREVVDDLANPSSKDNGPRGARGDSRDLRLTNEELAPLAGVSRRSIQAWVAGEQIRTGRSNASVRCVMQFGLWLPPIPR